MKVIEIRPPHPRAGRYVNWSAYRHGFPHTEPVWRMCATCWGQGRIWIQTRQGLRPAYCPTCLGLKEIAA